MQKVELFKPEDFEGTYGHFQKEAHAKFAEIANKKLQEYLESCPVVYGYRYETGAIKCKHHKSDGDNFKARLAFIEELLKPCKHEPKFTSIRLPNGFGYHEIQSTEVRCKHCNVEMIAEWKAKQ